MKGSEDFETKFPVPVRLGPSSLFDCSKLRLLDDSIVERTEELMIHLRLTDQELASQVTVSPSMAKIIIQDNDDPKGKLGKPNV